MNQELEELDSITPNAITDEKKIDEIKPKSLAIIAAAIGILCFFLPWIRFDIFGLWSFSLNGFNIPTTADYFESWAIYLGGDSGGVSILFLLYLVPLFFISILVLEYFKKTRWIWLLALGILILISAFIVGVVYNAGFSGAFELFSFGIFGSLITGGILVFRKSY